MDQDTCYTVIKTLVTRINKGALKIITRKKIRPHFKEHYTKIDDISLMVFGTVYLHFYILIFDIGHIFDVLRSSSTAPTPFV